MWAKEKEKKEFRQFHYSTFEKNNIIEYNEFKVRIFFFQLLSRFSCSLVRFYFAMSFRICQIWSIAFTFYLPIVNNKIVYSWTKQM